MSDVERVELAADMQKEALRPNGDFVRAAVGADHLCALEKRVTQLEEALQGLFKAYRQGKAEFAAEVELQRRELFEGEKLRQRRAA